MGPFQLYFYYYKQACSFRQEINFVTEKERIIYSPFDRENILVGREMLLEGVFAAMRAKQLHWTQVTLVEKNFV